MCRIFFCWVAKFQDIFAHAKFTSEFSEFRAFRKFRLQCCRYPIMYVDDGHGHGVGLAGFNTLSS